MLAPPRDESELMARTHALFGCTLDDLAARLGRPLGATGVHGKGKVGELLERALGATGGPRAAWDFPALRVELKTVPVDVQGSPTESTFVCSVSLRDADRAEWATSWVRAKLARVLWVPVTREADGARTIAEGRLWSPTAEQERVLAADYGEILGRVGAGGVEGVSARVGRWLQLRPKAAHGGVRTRAPAEDGGTLWTVPRGLYLRARFTGAILRDPRAMPGCVDPT
jgi:DNA mismatch repair protein MutH